MPLLPSLLPLSCSLSCFLCLPPGSSLLPRAFLLHRINRRVIIEFAISDAIEEALPLVAVEDQDPPGGIARHPHQHPVPTARRGPGDHGHFDGAVARTR